ncbi:MAG: hypothetical protein IJF50_08535 [Peptococcaceae bacterium]|nr:hypothetical protein [Peptococcaceae bacterium]MBQ2994257.1 hypothetical protein [Peptococcaceae bacterium]
MKTRLQKKHQKLLQENKQLKGQLGRELRAELTRLPWMNQQEIEVLKEDVQDLYLKDKSLRYLVKEQGIKQRKMQADINELWGVVDKALDKMNLLCATIIFCTILWAIMLF